MKTCTLNDVVIGTIFRISDFTGLDRWYEKTATFKGEDVKCEPILGGKPQPSLAEWIPLNRVIDVFWTKPTE